MRWEEERYVRVYIRDTADWLALSWDGQALLLQLLRKVDRAGFLHLGKHGKKAVAIVLNQVALWESRVSPALEELLSDGCVVLDSGDASSPGGDVTQRLRFRNFVPAQEAKASGKVRTAEWRERKGLIGDAASPRGDETSALGDEPRQAVTRGDPSLALLSRTKAKEKKEQAQSDLLKPVLELPLAVREAGQVLSPFAQFLTSTWADITATKAIELEELWRESCPGIDLLGEARKALARERESPRNRKTNHATYVGNWVRRAQQYASQQSPGSGDRPRFPIPEGPRSTAPSTDKTAAYLAQQDEINAQVAREREARKAGGRG